jgi:hypothetical protein
MSRCHHHPDRETHFYCSKYQIYLCEACLKCRDPQLYCKFRSACPIWFLSKTSEKWDDEDQAAATGS